MGKAEIISGGTDGRYQIKLMAYTDRAEARIDAIEEELEKIDNAEGVEISPPLEEQQSSLVAKINAYKQAIEDDRTTEEEDRQLQKTIAFEQAKLETLQDELSELESIRDEKLGDYNDALATPGLSQEELDWWESRYLSAQADVTAKTAQVASQQAKVAGYETEQEALEYSDLDKDLDAISKDAKTFLEFNPEESLAQLEEHLDLAEDVLQKMSDAFNSSIQWFKDATTENMTDQEEYYDIITQQYPVKQQADDYWSDAQEKKSALDSANSEYEDAYVQFLRGEITEAELQPYVNARDSAAALYGAALASWAYWNTQWEDLETQKNQCVTIATDPMKERMDETAKVFEEMSQLVGALRSFKERLELKKEALEKEKERLEKAIDHTERQVEAWCADLTEDLTGEVGTIEVAGQGDQIIILPGYSGEAAYDEQRDGALMPPELGTPASAFYNYAMMPGWQKWKPTFRVGEITSIDGDICRIKLDPVLSTAQRLDVNQNDGIANLPINYMNCNGAAFKIGDRVVVKFNAQLWDSSKAVIGFEKEPQPCQGECLVVRATGDGVDLAVVWDIERDDYAIVEDLEFPCTWTELEETDWYAARESVKQVISGNPHGSQDDQIIKPESCLLGLACNIVGPGVHSCSDTGESGVLGYDYAGNSLQATYYGSFLAECKEDELPGDPYLARSEMTQNVSHPNVAWDSSYLILYANNPTGWTPQWISAKASAPPFGMVTTLPNYDVLRTNLQYEQSFVYHMEKPGRFDPANEAEEAETVHYFMNPLTGKHELFRCTHSYVSRVGFTDKYIRTGKSLNLTVQGSRSFCQFYLYDCLETTEVWKYIEGGYPISYYMDSQANQPRRLVGLCSATIVEDWWYYEVWEDAQSQALFAAIELLLDTWYVESGTIMSEQIGAYSLSIDVIGLN